MNRKSSLNVKTRARIHARVDMRHEPDFAGSLMRFVEMLDEQPEFRSLKFSTLVGAARAAARELGRLDAAGNITAAS